MKNHKLKVCAYGDKGVIFGINKSYLEDAQSGQTIIKCSGLRQKKAETLFKQSSESTKQLFPCAQPF